LNVEDIEYKKNTQNSINYWKEIEEELPNELQNLNGIILLTYNSVEFTHIINFLQNIRKGEFLTVLYISLVRSYNYIKSALDLKPLNQKKIMFIDCVSGYAFPIDEQIDEAFYHKPPLNLDEMKEIIQFGIDKTNPDIIIIDSLSQFINFSKTTSGELSQFYEFLKNIKENTISITQNTFILLYDTKLGAIQCLPKKNMDSIFKIEISK